MTFFCGKATAPTFSEGGSVRGCARGVAVALTLFLLVASGGVARGAVPPPLKDKGTGLAMSSHPLASAVGAAVLARGGNAVDAAVAVGFALAVVHPSAGNLGGGGFAIVRLANGTTGVLDFRETAPARARRDMYLDERGEIIQDLSTTSYLAAGVPGTVAGLAALRDRFGTLPLRDLVMPAVTLAEEGFAVNARQEQTFADEAHRLIRFASTRAYFMKPDGSTLKEGDRLIQKDLGKTLRRIARNGPDAFYKGEIAALIEKDMRANGGIMDARDLAAYRPVWREPLRGSYRGYEIITVPPSSSGGVHLVQMLNIMEKSDVKGMGFGTARTIHLMAEAMRYAYADRSKYMGDPDFVKVPVAALTDKAYAGRIHARIMRDPEKAASSADVRPGAALPEKSNTTHFSVVDASGNAVSLTYTINDTYGSGAAVAGAGFLLNNEMDDFVSKPGVPNFYGLIGSDANAIEPGKRPLSCMTPTIVLRDGKPFLVVGSPGGPRIITTVLQVISNIIDHGMDLSRAVYAPRVHMQWMPDELRVEAFGVNPDVAERLRGMGYTLTLKPDMGDVNAILLDETGKRFGVTDPRREF